MQNIGVQGSKDDAFAGAYGPLWRDHLLSFFVTSMKALNTNLTSVAYKALTTAQPI